MWLLLVSILANYVLGLVMMDKTQTVGARAHRPYFGNPGKPGNPGIL